jgi:hypothetical protein
MGGKISKRFWRRATGFDAMGRMQDGRYSVDVFAGRGSTAVDGTKLEPW